VAGGEKRTSRRKKGRKSAYMEKGGRLNICSCRKKILKGRDLFPQQEGREKGEDILAAREKKTPEKGGGGSLFK